MGTPMAPEGYAAPPPTYAPPPRRNRWIIPVIAVIVVVVLIVAVVLVLGVFKPGSSGTGSGGATPDFGSAQSAAANTANGQSGGPWKFYAAFGIAPSFSETATLNTSFFTLGSSCSAVHLDIANNTAITVSAFGGSLSSGQASAWIFIYASANGILSVFDNGGNTYALASATCTQIGALISYIQALPSGISSSAAASTAWAHGGSAFAGANAKTSVDYSLFSGISYLGISQSAKWGISYDACTASDASSGATAPSTSVDVNATNNAFLDVSNGTTSCGFSSPGGSGGGGGTGGSATLSSDLGFGAAWVSATGATYSESANVTKANGGLHWSNISLIAVNTTGFTNFLSVGWVNITSGSTLLASYDLMNDTWLMGSSTAIAVGQSVWIAFGSQNPSGVGWTADFNAVSPPGAVYIHLK
jgi:hypothetical protein